MKIAFIWKIYIVGILCVLQANGFLFNDANGCKIYNNRTVLECISNKLTSFPSMESEVAKKIKTIFISDQPFLKILTAHDLQNYSGLINITFAKTGLQRIQWETFLELSEQNQISVCLIQNNFTHLDWQSFVGVNALDIIKENGIEMCECRNFWLTSGHQKNETLAKDLALPVVALNASCKSKPNCPRPIVTLETDRNEIDEMENVTIQCIISNTIDHFSGINGRKFIVMPNGQNPEDVQTESFISQNQAAVKLTAFVKNISRSNLGWVICWSWHSNFPAYAKVPLKIRTRPTVQKGPVRNTHSNMRTSIYFVITGYPLENLNITVLNGDKEVPYLTDQKGKTFSKIKNIKRRMVEVVETPQLDDFYRKIIKVRLASMGFKANAFKYSLIVCNLIGCSDKTTDIKLEPKKMSVPWLDGSINTEVTHWYEYLLTVLAISFGVLLIAGCLVMTLMYRYRKLGLNVNRTEFIPLKDNSAYHPVAISENVRLINEKGLDIVREIGEGAFGKVYLATWKFVLQQSDTDSSRYYYEHPSPKSVAVKAPKQVANMQIIQLRQEAELLSQLSHPNIVRFYGVAVENEDLLLVFEFMDLGDLKKYLRKCGPEASLISHASDEEPRSMTMSDQLNITIQVAKGLEYLHSKTIIHRDLAARNCLLSSEQVPPAVKLSDFGMSRQIYSAEYYQINQKRAPMPIRWLPAESLMLGHFSRETDIWSMGVVMWEIFTFGRQPYGHLSNPDVVEAIQNGVCLAQVDPCPGVVYSLMKRCWEQCSEDRIKICELLRELQVLIQKNLAASSDDPILGRKNRLAVPNRLEDIKQHSSAC